MNRLLDNLTRPTKKKTFANSSPTPTEEEGQNFQDNLTIGNKKKDDKGRQRTTKDDKGRQRVGLQYLLLAVLYEVHGLNEFEITTLELQEILFDLKDKDYTKNYISKLLERLRDSGYIKYRGSIGCLGYRTLQIEKPYTLS